MSQGQQQTTKTRTIFWFRAFPPVLCILCILCGKVFSLRLLRFAQQPEKTARDAARGTPAALAEPVLGPVERAQEQQAEGLAIGLRRQRQRRHQRCEQAVVAVAQFYHCLLYTSPSP